jgi:hypothetical protein
MREAGLPPLLSDDHGEYFLLLGSKGIVRAVHPETNRVDIETEDGSYLSQVLVMGPYFPEVHRDTEAPSHVTYLHVRGQAEAFCWPETHRRLLGPHDGPATEETSGAPERRYFHQHHYILRLGDITIRISRDDRLVLETEAGDYIQLDRHSREIRLHAPTVLVGTTEQGTSKIAYEQDDSIRAFTPLFLLGTETGDRIEYRDGAEILLQAPLVKITADQIVLDPVSIKLGHANASERALLGDLWMAFYNTFVTLFNGHVHTNVQPGTGVSGAPSALTPAMTDAVLSDVTRISKTGL